ncbi:MAG: hypothetical protein OEN23_12305 [Paracoccaceae bacterium]|nr:hypothetical protein [Paracoccaceae bacterium]
MPISMLMLGASYGSLLATKLVLAGHDVTLVCLPEEVALFNADGARVRIKPRGHDDFVELDSRDGPGRLSAAGPTEVDPKSFDIVGLAMQEPQYRAPEVKDLIARIARSARPTMSIMNMPPPPFLARIAAIDPDGLASAYTDYSVWRGFAPGLMTLASPDPQAMRPPGEPLNVLQVNLPTNFKVAPFADDAHTDLLRRMEANIEALRFGSGQIELPVKLRVHDSLFVPLAKWAMLVTGNYRCVTSGAPISIRDAVHGDLELSRRIYAAVGTLCERLGAKPGDLVPFEKYAKAAESLIRPSSAARALDAGAPAIERLDKLVQLLSRQTGVGVPAVDEIAALVDAKLLENAAPMPA